MWSLLFGFLDWEASESPSMNSGCSKGFSFLEYCWIKKLISWIGCVVWPWEKLFLTAGQWVITKLVPNWVMSLHCCPECVWWSQNDLWNMTVRWDTCFLRIVSRWYHRWLRVDWKRGETERELKYFSPKFKDPNRIHLKRIFGGMQKAMKSILAWWGYHLGFPERGLSPVWDDKASRYLRVWI